MTVLIETAKAVELIAAGTTNNPIVFWNNEATSATYSTTTGTEVESAALAATGTTYDAWVCTPNVNDDVAILVAFPSNVTINAIGLAAHNIADVGGRILFQYHNGSSWFTIGTETPPDNQAILCYFSDVTATDWRIKVNDVTDDVEIAIAFFGNVLTLPQRIYQGYAPPLTPNNVILQSNVSQGGNLLGALVSRRGSSLSANIEHLPANFVRGSDFTGFMQHHNDGKGFFWAWRPTKYDDLFYAWREGAVIAPSNTGPLDLMGFSMGLRCYDNP